MKTYKNLFENICSFENLMLAYKKARRGKRYQNSVLSFSFDLENNLLKLQEDLLSGKYNHGKYRIFQVYDPKKRLIKAAPFRDRVIHHAICNIIEPIFDKRFIFDSYACRKNKGTHVAVERLQKFIRKLAVTEEGYVLQCDIRKYFQSINHVVLKEIIKRKIQDTRLLALIDKIINSSCDSSEKGIPIGNLTSQLFANMYLNELDYFIKFELGVKYYVRYMDDFLILDNSKKKLQNYKNEIRTFLKTLELELNPKKVIVFPAKIGVDFLGYIIFKDYKKLRKSNIKRFISRTERQMKNFGIKDKENKFFNSVQSWVAHACFGDTYYLRKHILLRFLEILMKNFEGDRNHFFYFINKSPSLDFIRVFKLGQETNSQFMEPVEKPQNILEPKSYSGVYERK